MTNSLRLTLFCWLLGLTNWAVAQDELYGAIDTSGQTVIPFVYNSLSTPTYGVLVANQNNRFGLLDTEGEEVAPFIYSSIGSFENGMAVYSVAPQTCGYMDTLGQAVIRSVYDRCEPFHDSLAWVGKMQGGELRYGTINRRGEQVIPFQYEAPGKHTAMDGLYKIKQGGLYGLIDRKGQVLADPQYDRMSVFSEGRLRVMKGLFFGFLDYNGQEVIPCQYYWARDFLDGQSYTGIGNEIYLINLQGDTIYDARGLHLQSVFSEDGLARIKTNGKEGFINRERELVVPPHYQLIEQVRYGLRRVKLDRKEGMLDENWEVVIPLEYDALRADTGGSIIAWKNGRCGVIDYSNNIVIPFEYDNIEGFREGRDFTVVTKGYRNAVADRSGNILVPFDYAPATYLRFPFGLDPFRKDGKIGYLNLRGETKIPFIYKTASPFTKYGIAVCSK
ncbi:MAG: WG repeat-containing protein [Bacteroidota bacterium]